MSPAPLMLCLALPLPITMCLTPPPSTFFSCADDGDFCISIAFSTFPLLHGTALYRSRVQRQAACILRAPKSREREVCLPLARSHPPFPGFPFISITLPLPPNAAFFASPAPCAPIAETSFGHLFAVPPPLSAIRTLSSQHQITCASRAGAVFSFFSVK
eukprot:RCo035916